MDRLPSSSEREERYFNWGLVGAALYLAGFWSLVGYLVYRLWSR